MVLRSVLISFFYMQLSSFPNTIYWGDCLSPIVYSCLLCCSFIFNFCHFKYGVSCVWSFCWSCLGCLCFLHLDVWFLLQVREAFSCWLYVYVLYPLSLSPPCGTPAHENVSSWSAAWGLLSCPHFFFLSFLKNWLTDWVLAALGLCCCVRLSLVSRAQ